MRGQRLCAGEKGGEKTGPNPTDRAASAISSLALNGIPLAIRLTAANTHDSRVFEELINAVPPIRQCLGRPRKRPAKLHADRAYDVRGCHKGLTKRRIKDRTCVQQGRDTGDRRSLSRRLVVRGRAQDRLASGRASGA